MIAVNLVTGFLGTGKTTLIRHLLQHKPEQQRWAVLVNEFGEAGVDGLLLDETGVAIEEVAGGCLCCVAAPAFGVGLNRLIRQQRPDRILIEPSGLGHPAQILEQLRSPLYQGVLHLQATLCVMDARHLDSARHREHPNFIDQIHLADILIANKADAYSEVDEDRLLTFAATLEPRKARIVITEYGIVDPALLSLGAEEHSACFPEAHAYLLAQAPGIPKAEAAQRDWLNFEGKADGYYRAGWLIGSGYGFDREALLAWLDALPQERIKGLFRCEAGDFSYNRAGGDCETRAAAAGESSRLQLIDSRPMDLAELELALRGLALDDSGTR